MEIDKIAVGNRIKKERKLIGLTQEELATKLGLNNKSSVCQYENGDTLPGDEIKIKLINLFNCSLDYLLCKTDERNPGQDVLGLEQLGFNIKDYTPPTQKQKEQIKEIIETILKDNKKENK